MISKLKILIILAALLSSVLITVYAATDGPMLFTSFRDGSREIYAMSLDEGSQTQLTYTGEALYPAWSPDYRQIAYVARDENGNFVVFIMNADGTNAHPVTDASMGIYAESPTWSPDGRQIAFVTIAGMDQRQVQVVNVDGTNAHPLIESTEETFDPAWSPDGRQIAYAVAQNSEYSAIFVANADGSGVPNQLSREDGGESLAPAWSPDGTKIVYAVTGGSHGDAIMVRDPDGVLNAVYTATSPDAFPNSPVWSPDGSMIAFTEEIDYNPIIKVMNADGSDVRQLSEVENGEYLAWAAPAQIAPITVNSSENMAVPVTSGIITTPRLNVRSQPNPETYIVSRISLNDTVSVIGRNDDGTWVMIDVFGRVGWVNSEYIAVSGGIGSLPALDSNAPLPAPSSIFTFTCPGARGPSFNLNSRFIIPYGDGPTFVRELPSSRVVLEEAPEGSGGTIIAGPICSAASENRVLVYWYVRTDAGTRGYISEGYLSDSIPWIAPE